MELSHRKLFNMLFRLHDHLVYTLYPWKHVIYQPSTKKMRTLKTDTKY